MFEQFSIRKKLYFYSFIFCRGMLRNNLNLKKSLSPLSVFMLTKTFSSTKSYYEILKIPMNASNLQIKQAYYSLAKKHHPDMNKCTDEIFKEISKAYSVLSDENLRANYDYCLKHGLDTNFDSRSPTLRTKLSKRHRNLQEYEFVNSIKERILKADQVRKHFFFF